MTGTVLNVVAIIVGSLIGLLIGNRLPKKIQDAVITGLGFTTLVIGVETAMGSGNILLPLMSIASGVIIGEVLDIDGGLRRFGGWLQSRVARTGGTAAEQGGEHVTEKAISARVRFISGFVTSSLVFCIGPMAILGSIQNGIDAADVRLLAIKSTLDFFASIAFAASLGVGVMFSIIPTVVLQGGFALVGMLLAGGAAGLTDQTPFIRELSATGGLILVGLSLILLDIKQPRVANYLPALLVAPLLVVLAGVLGINIYPG
jgi:hypothetical protein